MTYKPIGTVTLLININYLPSIIKEIDVGKGGKVIITDSSGNVIADKDSIYKINENIGETNLISKFKTESKPFQSKFKGKGSLISFNKLDGIEWYVIGVIPNSYINQEAAEIQKDVILIILLCVIISLILSYLISNSVSQPLKKLVNVMAEAEKGNLGMNIEDGGRDEISGVMLKFNHMLKNIRTLISKVQDSTDGVYERASRITEASERACAASTQVAATTQEVAKGATSQAEDISKGVDYLNKLSIDMNVAGTGVQKMSDVVTSTKKLSDNALLSVSELTDKAEQTKEVTLKITEDINKLNGEMKEIKTLLKS